VELLRTPRLVLRSWESGDVDAFYDLYSRWEVMRRLGAHPRRVLAGIDEARTRIERWQATEAPPLGLWAIVPTGASAPVGTVLLLPLADADGPTDEVEIGWHLHPDHWGRGLATEAAAALLKEAALPRVLALTDPDNERSQAVARRLGMADEGLTDRWFGTTTRQFAI
jgi:RimJ/RimL family protein N-acetyltransferase